METSPTFGGGSKVTPRTERTGTFVRTFGGPNARKSLNYGIKFWDRSKTFGKTPKKKPERKTPPPNDLRVGLINFYVWLQKGGLQTDCKGEFADLAECPRRVPRGGAAGHRSMWIPSAAHRAMRKSAPSAAATCGLAPSRRPRDPWAWPLNPATSPCSPPRLSTSRPPSGPRLPLTFSRRTRRGGIPAGSFTGGTCGPVGPAGPLVRRSVRN